ncbi:MAG: hypothetical protein A3C90_02525 [Candidatus Magasanikbacteria bacterium RIFCSPHIGHO2_02_FULL_51_14]|uniref:Uncharacterized protein n=1 Tax=Candidatus Magasanikbacteria bacterium RIFCSPHIGHO2_02_FULL_51_14 TaxID=1798683 RepID=A0A1F6MDE0_9BACT|nr:MAG: hypothetical protein A3C90_02525 [Candidatus Magasanikbacteria bacterium RIFCSPHIGHO2_02_FULL_51_14]
MEDLPQNRFPSVIPQTDARRLPIQTAAIPIVILLPTTLITVRPFPILIRLTLTVTVKEMHVKTPTVIRSLTARTIVSMCRIPIKQILTKIARHNHMRQILYAAMPATLTLTMTPISMQSMPVQNHLSDHLSMP